MGLETGGQSALPPLYGKDGQRRALCFIYFSAFLFSMSHMFPSPIKSPAIRRLCYPHKGPAKRTPPPLPRYSALRIPGIRSADGSS